MSSNSTRAPIAILAAAAWGAVILGAAAPAGAASAFPLFGGKPAPAPASAKPAASAPTRATPEERAAADRLDPLSRSVFWAHQANLDPTDVQAGTELAAALRLCGHYDEAQQAVGRVLVVQPHDLEALLESARSYVADNKGFYALEPLKTALAVAPRDWRAYSLMGIAREQNQQPDDARAAFLQALQLSPENPAVLSNLAIWEASHGDHAQAETLLRRAAAEPTSSAKERQNLALLLGMEGHIPDAERLMREDLPPEVAKNNLAYLRAVNGATP